MSELIPLLLTGLATGAIYALAAVGFTLLWQTTQTINFAQGEFVMLPAILILAAAAAGLPLWLAILAGGGMFVLVFGLGFKRLVVDPMIRQGVLPLAIATMALGVLMKEGAKDFFSAEAKPFPSLVPDGVVGVLGVNLSIKDLAIAAVAVGAIVALQAFVARTRTGRMMQACAQNPDVARILGVPVERMILLTFT
ncbi:MAG TPA: branched-chain amino acid ABC transporter permease, partial [Salinarimonas sp.]|nr:branched-chain amino acid ABC transporter permease [Salinarimonas sp.]